MFIPPSLWWTVLCGTAMLRIYGAIETADAIGWCRRLKAVNKSVRVEITARVWDSSQGRFGTRRRLSGPRYEDQYRIVNEWEDYCCNGYVLNNEQCEPSCPEGCAPHGNCPRPYLCQCNPGYRTVNNRCKPICPNGCPAHSNCTAPNKCTCYEGYHVKDGRVCEPTCEHACPAFAQCTAPGQCDCEPGYKDHNSSSSGTSAINCAPVCSQGCPANSVCVQPDHCDCVPGYKWNESGAECRPVCVEPCPALSICHRPNECLCPSGYYMKVALYQRPRCAPICARNCSAFGSCVAPDTCECVQGYRERPQPVPAAANDSIVCEPVCDGGCANGFCFRPGMCVCNMGYLMGPQNVCKPVCSLGCENAECVEPELCVCQPGYAFANNSVSACVPQCEPPCVNGHCAAPNVCICYHNYQPNGTQSLPQSQSEMDALTLASNVCVPSCMPACINGTCIEPNTCRCNKGYTAAPSADAKDSQGLSEDHCRPVCRHCSHGGDCIAPNVCACWPGYGHSDIDGSCQPDDDEMSTSSAATAATTTTTTTTNTAYDFDVTTISTMHRRSTREEVFHTAYLVDAADCLTDCGCWVYGDDFGVLSNAKCERICTLPAETNCLDLTKCRCDSSTWAIKCNSMLEDSSEEDESAGYLCKEGKTSPQIVLSTTTTTTTITKKDLSDIDQAKSDFTQHILYGIVGIVACSALGIGLVIYYKKYFKTGEQYVMSDNAAELYELNDNCD